MNFEFISDKRFRELLERDYQELQICLESKAVKSVLVLSGSIIEAMLTEYFIQFPPTGLNEAQILKSTLNELINWAVQENVISDKEKNLASVVKDYRNLIHPGREIRKDEKFDIESASIAYSVLSIILSSVKLKYVEKYGYSADEVFEKLKKDWYFQSIYDKVILKLNHNERTKLLNHLVDFEIWEKSFWECFQEEGIAVDRNISNLENVKPFVVKLKPLVPNTIIKEYLQKMIQEIETGESLNAYSLYNLFHEDLDILSNEEKELVVIYLLHLFSNVLEKSGVVGNDKTYSTIGKHITSDKLKEELIEFISFCVANFYPKKIEEEMDILEQVFNSLPDEIKTEADKHLVAYLAPVDKLPPDIRIFYDEAVKRKIITIANSK